jgi:hypothetical protein
MLKNEKEDVKMHTTEISENDGSASVELCVRKLDNRAAM